MSKSSGSKSVANGRIVNTKAYREWKRGLEWSWVRARQLFNLPVPSKVEVRIRMRYCFIMPTLHARDLADNVISGAVDSMKGILIRDDADIWDSHGTKHMDRDLTECQLWLRIERL